MRTRLLILISALGLGALQTANAQSAGQQPPGASTASSSSSAPTGAGEHQPTVIVSGRRAELAKKVTAFVNEVTDFNSGDPGRGLARWQQGVCPLVTGIPKQQGEYILARISEVAQAVGAPLAGDSCRPNLFILVSTQPEALLKGMARQRGSVIFGGATPDVVDYFIATSRPVRTWYDTEERTPEGSPLLHIGMPGLSAHHTIEASAGVFINVPVRPSSAEDSGIGENHKSNASHLTLNVVWAIAHAYVIVDPTQLKGVPLGQLADYLAMAGLAQVRVDSRLGDAPTILTLFDHPSQAGSTGLTDWDRAFLKSFYSTEQKSVKQRTEIALDMTREIAP